jgi:hypothetical protein
MRGKIDMKKLVLIIAAFVFFAGCSLDIYYNADLKQLPDASIKNEAIILSGVYRSNLPFNAVAVQIDSGQKYRIVVLNDLGIELFQMEIQKDYIGKTSVSKSVLGKKELKEFTDFFASYFYAAQSKYALIEESDGKIYYKKDGKTIIWALKQ